MVGFKPAKGRILVEPDKGPKKIGSIYLGGDAPEMSSGKVVAIGEGVDSVAIGDHVHYSKYEYANIELGTLGTPEHRALILVKEEAILGVEVDGQ